MKLNSTTEMMACSDPGIANIHPFAPSEQTFGYRWRKRAAEPL